MKRAFCLILLSLLALGASAEAASWGTGTWGTSTWTSGGDRIVRTTQPSTTRAPFLHRTISSVAETESVVHAEDYISKSTYVLQPFDKAEILARAYISTVTTSCSIVLVPYVQSAYDANPYALRADAWTITASATGEIRRALVWDAPEYEPYAWVGESVTNGVVTGPLYIYVRPMMEQ